MWQVRYLERCVDGLEQELKAAAAQIAEHQRRVQLLVEAGSDSNTQLQRARISSTETSRRLQHVSQELHNSKALVLTLELEVSNLRAQLLESESATAEMQQQLSLQLHENELSSGRLERELSATELQIEGAEAIRAAEKQQLAAACLKLTEAEFRSSELESRLSHIESQNERKLQVAKKTIEQLREELRRVGERPSAAGSVEHGQTSTQDIRSNRFAALESSLMSIDRNASAQPESHSPTVSAEYVEVSSTSKQHELEKVIDRLQYQPLQANEDSKSELSDAGHRLAAAEARGDRLEQELWESRRQLCSTETKSFALTGRLEDALHDSAAKLELAEASIVLLQQLTPDSTCQSSQPADDKETREQLVETAIATRRAELQSCSVVIGTRSSPPARLRLIKPDTNSMDDRFDCLKSKQESMIKHMEVAIIDSVKTSCHKSPNYSVGKVRQPGHGRISL